MGLFSTTAARLPISGCCLDDARLLGLKQLPAQVSHCQYAVGSQHTCVKGSCIYPLQAAATILLMCPAADANLSPHFKVNLWNISFNDLLTYRVSGLGAAQLFAAWQQPIQAREPDAQNISGIILPPRQSMCTAEAQQVYDCLPTCL
jgi:hypothetical protein